MTEDTPNLHSFLDNFFLQKSKKSTPSFLVSHLSSFIKLFLFTQIQTAIWWSSLPSSRHQRRRLLEEEKEE
jgi:hypothetical protein